VIWLVSAWMIVLSLPAPSGEDGFRAGLAAEPFDPATEVGVSVKKGVGDAGFALDGLEGDRLVALDQGSDRGLGGFRLGFRLAAGSLAEGTGAALA
jgi:hypothetical protein